MTDPIADLFASLKNGWKVRKKSIVVPYSNTKIALLKIFKDKNIIGDFNVESDDKGNGVKKSFKIHLSYNEDNLPIIEDIKRISKPGRRIYFHYNDLKPVRQGYGFRIISTSQGIMIDNEAKKRKLGGEIICEVI